MNDIAPWRCAALGAALAIGLMIGLVCKVANVDVVKAAYGEHLLTVPGGQNVIRLLPALTISDEEIAEGISRLDRAASEIELAGQA